MRTDIYINAASNESRIAIVEDGRLAELWVERLFILMKTLNSRKPISI